MMLSTTFLLFVATVLSAESGVIEIDLGSEAGLRLGDVGRVYYEQTVDDETQRVDVGTGTVIEANAHTAQLQVAADADMRPDYKVEFKIPVLPEAGRKLLRFRVEPVSDPKAGKSANGEPSMAVTLNEVRRLVQNWAEAWSEQEVDLYLSFYASNFQPPGGMNRGEWETLRRKRISTPSFVAVSLEKLKIVTPASNTAVATFVQIYRSDNYEDRVSKVLDVVREDGEWRILEEKVEE